jgi:nitroimidazol reductase NimA-like FMN-containing flavoprotein (pyridoxamine 5'-phosphate oxidase superfamily)
LQPSGIMVVTEMSLNECAALLARNRVAHLACAFDGQPYVVPLTYAADESWLYGLSTVGRKIEWLRQNPRACVVVDEIVGPEQWSSVVITGRFEELPDTPVLHEIRTRAYTLLNRSASWWVGAYRRLCLAIRRMLALSTPSTFVCRSTP